MFEGMAKDNVVAVFEFYELDCVGGGCGIGIWLQFEDHVMDRISIVKFARHWHGLCTKVTMMGLLNLVVCHLDSMF